MRHFVQIEHVHSHFDPKNEWVKNMFNSDIYSNPMDAKYNRANILSQKKEHGKKWREYMKHNNK